MSLSLPQVYGVSSLQRQSRAILDQVNASKAPVFLTEKNKVSYVVVRAEDYEAMNNESYFWSQVQGAGLDFWQHEFNDAYNEL